MNFAIPLYSNDDTNRAVGADLCAICLDNMNANPTHTLRECNHTFHASCLIDALRVNQSCPLCRGIPRINCNNGVVLRHIIAYSKSKKNKNKRLRALILEYEKARTQCSIMKKKYQQFCKDQKEILKHHTKLKREKNKCFYQFRKIKRIVSSLPIRPINK
jgi:hypothetical protein